MDPVSFPCLKPARTFLYNILAPIASGLVPCTFRSPLPMQCEKALFLNDTPYGTFTLRGYGNGKGTGNGIGTIGYYGPGPIPGPGAV